MSQQNVLYPYHPITGLRLVASVDFISGQVPRDIHKQGGAVVLGEASETIVFWDGAEEQKLAGALFLADENGNECLDIEAIWHSQEVDSVPRRLGATVTTSTMPNSLRDALQELASAAREVILDINTGKDGTASAATLRTLLEAKNLWEDFDE